MNPDEYLQHVIENVEFAGDELWQDELHTAVTMLNQRDRRIAELEAELARMIGEMRIKGYAYELTQGSDPGSIVEMVIFKGGYMGTTSYFKGKTLPEAVKAAYEEVLGG